MSIMSHILREVSIKAGSAWHRMQRTKSSVTQDDMMSTQLRRCLTTFDIILLGIGHMVGSGAYVLTSSVAKNIAGPAIVLSYILAGFAAFLCALCYAEFSVRFPKCGSAYSYTYIALGEIWAFIVGWNMILENVIGIAAVSRACSAYLDSTIGGEMRTTLANMLSSILGSNITAHMDLLSGGIAMATAVFLTFGLNVTTYVNNTFSIINIAAIAIIIVVGGYFSSYSNWTNVPGGFMPYGWTGVFQGAATCYYGYIGFDSVATSGEEAKDPQKSIPLATFVSMSFATFSYVGVSMVMTLMVPYNQIADESGLPDALGLHGATWAKMAVIIGACCGMVTVLIGTIYSLTRIVYAMADDGLLFPWMGYVNHRTQIPLLAMYFFTTLGVILAIFIDITTLVEMMSIGTLIAYLVVSASIIVVRYKKPNLERQISLNPDDSDDDGGYEADEQENLLPNDSGESNKWTAIKAAFKDVFNREYLMRSLKSYFKDSLVSVCVATIVVLATLFCLAFKLLNKPGVDDKPVVFLLSLIATLLCIVIAVISMQEQNVENLRYKVPMVPIVPVVSIFFNISLIINLNFLTWARFIFWMTIGLSIYAFYGMKHSKASYGSELSTAINKNWSSLADAVLDHEDQADGDIEAIAAPTHTAIH